MAAQDIAQLLYLRLWTLLGADADFNTEFKAGRLIHYADADPWPDKRFRTGPGDFPQLEIDYAEGDDSAFTEDEHWGTGDASDGVAEVSTHTFVVTIRWRDTRLTTANSGVNVIRRVLRDADEDLGLAYVDRWRFTRRDRIVEPVEDDARGTRRRVTVLTIPITLTLEGAEETE